MADLLKSLLELLGDGASAGSNGTVSSFNNNGGGPQNFSRANINSGAHSGDGNGPVFYGNSAKNGAPRGSNGTVRSFNNNGTGDGGQDFSGATINSGACSGNGNGSHNWNNFGGSVINNRGVTYGNGNGSIIRGNFDSSTREYYN